MLGFIYIFKLTEAFKGAITSYNLQSVLPSVLLSMKVNIIIL